MPSRRAYLTALTAVGLAGCVGDSPDSTTGSPAEATTTGTSTPSRPAVRIEAAAVQYAYRYFAMDWNAVRTADGQFVFVTVDASGADPVPGRRAFALATADERHDPIALEDRFPSDLDVPGEPYTPDRDAADPRGWLMFDVPARLDAAPSLRLDRDTGSWEWRLDTETATAPPPVWEWTASAPETVAPGETFDITVSAENVGDGPGTFRGAVNFSHPVSRAEPFDVVLDSGQSGEATVSASSEGVDSGTELDYGVRTPAGKSEVAVAVEAGSSATERTN